jgi:hypothetical protein
MVDLAVQGRNGRWQTQLLGPNNYFAGGGGISLWVEPRYEQINEDSTYVVNTDLVEGYWEFIPTGFSGQQARPQDGDPWAWSYRRLTPEEIAGQRKLLENTLNQTECGEFVSDWLEELGRVTNTPVFSTNLLTVFDQIARTGTMTTTQENKFGRAGGSAGQGTGLVRLNLGMLWTLQQGPAEVL